MDAQIGQVVIAVAGLTATVLVAFLTARVTLRIERERHSREETARYIESRRELYSSTISAFGRARRQLDAVRTYASRGSAAAPQSSDSRAAFNRTFEQLEGQFGAVFLLGTAEVAERYGGALESIAHLRRLVVEPIDDEQWERACERAVDVLGQLLAAMRADLGVPVSVGLEQTLRD